MLRARKPARSSGISRIVSACAATAQSEASRARTSERRAAGTFPSAAEVGSLASARPILKKSIERPRNARRRYRPSNDAWRIGAFWLRSTRVASCTICGSRVCRSVGDERRRGAGLGGEAGEALEDPLAVRLRQAAHLEREARGVLARELARGTRPRRRSRGPRRGPSGSARGTPGTARPRSAGCAVAAVHRARRRPGRPAGGCAATRSIEAGKGDACEGQLRSLRLLGGREQRDRDDARGERERREADPRHPDERCARAPPRRASARGRRRRCRTEARAFRGGGAGRSRGAARGARRCTADTRPRWASSADSSRADSSPSR